MYWISFCSEDRPILTMAGFFVSQPKRRGWTTSSVEARTEREEGEREREGGGGDREGEVGGGGREDMERRGRGVNRERNIMREKGGRLGKRERKRIR